MRFPPTLTSILSAAFIALAAVTVPGQDRKEIETTATESTEKQLETAERQVELLKEVQAKRTAGRVQKPGSHLAAWTPELVCRLSLGIGAFAILSFALVGFLIWQKKNPEQLLRTFGILIVIFASVFLVVAGYSDTQITPVIGLLGTIAGYLLGRRTETNKKSENDPEHH